MNQEILQKLQAVFPEAITEKQVLDEKTGKVSFEYALKEEFINLLKDNLNLPDSQHQAETGKLYYTVNSLDVFTSYIGIKGFVKWHNLPREVL